MSKQIQLSQGKVAIVDNADYDALIAHGKWSFNSGYAAYMVSCKNGKGARSSKAMWMHRLIMNASDGFYVDHINGNKLDNRKSNLRFCSTSENLKNQGKRQSNKSGHKGVCWAKRNKKWIAKINVNYKCIHIGYFDCPIKAAKAYNEAAVKYHGKFAWLNTF